MLEEISRRERVTVLHVTHNLDEARRLADCLFSLVDGQIELENTNPDRVGVVYGSDYIMTQPEEFTAGVRACLDQDQEFHFAARTITGDTKV